MSAPTANDRGRTIALAIHREANRTHNRTGSRNLHLCPLTRAQFDDLCAGIIFNGHRRLTNTSLVYQADPFPVIVYIGLTRPTGEGVALQETPVYHPRP